MHPELLKIGPVTIYSYGALLGLAFLVCSLLAVKEGERRGIHHERMLDFLLATILVALVFSRMFYVLMRPAAYVADPLRAFSLGDGSLAFHGGLLGGVLNGLWFSRRWGVSFWTIADSVGAVLPLGSAIARWGCLLSGCCYGTLSTVAWAVTTQHAPGWRHPAQIYESLLDLAVFGMLAVYKKRRVRQGQVFLAYLALYSLVRFTVDFYRDSDLWIGRLTYTQAGSLVLLVLAVIASSYLRLRAVRASGAEGH